MLPFSIRHRLAVLAAFVGASESVVVTGTRAAAKPPREPTPVAIGSKSPYITYVPTGEPNPVPEWQNALDSAVARWRSLGISDYSYHFRLMVIFQSDEWMKVEVRDDAISNVYPLSGEPMPPDMEGWVPTVEEMFGIIQGAIDNDEYNYEYYDDYYYGGAQGPQQPVSVLEVTYDPDYGYPTSVYIDYSFRISDEELSFEVDSLEVAPKEVDCCVGVKKCGQNPHKCKCIDNKCKKKNKNCMTKGDDMESWGCRDGMTCVAEDNEDGKPKKWGKCLSQIAAIQ